MFNLYQTMNKHNEEKEKKEPDVIGHDRFCQERPSRSSYRKKRRAVARRAQSAAELSPSAVASANKRTMFGKTRSASTDNEDNEENNERTPLVAHSLARLLFNRSLGSNKNSPSQEQNSNKHGGRYQYTALEVDSGQHGERVELERKAREHALQICQQYLMTNPRYELLHHLNDIGSRVDKHWFVVKDSSVKTERLLTLVPKGQYCPIDCNQDTREIILELFRTLQHPYIYPVLDFEFTDTAQETYAVLVMPFNSKGSLKDLIYKSSWQEDWTHKYGERGDGLPLSQVQRLGRQILEALLFLKERGFPPYGHLHSGNVILQNGVARLAGLENTLLGFTSRIHPVVWTRARVAPTAVDTICFGHVLFEMTAGYELTIPQPTPGHLQLDLERYPQVVDVLELIFQHPEGRYPTIEELLLCDLFRNIDLREMRGSTIPGVFHHRLASPTKALLAEIKRAQFGVRPRRTHSASTSDCSTPPRERRVDEKSCSKVDNQTTDVQINIDDAKTTTPNSNENKIEICNNDSNDQNANNTSTNTTTIAAATTTGAASDVVDNEMLLNYFPSPEKHRNLLLHTHYQDDCCSLITSDTQCLIR